MNRRKAIQENDDSSSNNDDDLNFRVQDKSAIDPDAAGKKSRLGNILKDGGPIRGFKENAAETLKRPLTGLFRRPASKAGGRGKKEKEEEDESAQPPSNFKGVSKIASTLEDVILDDDSDNEKKNGGVSNRTNIGVEGISKAPTMSSTKFNPMIGTVINPKLAYLFKLDKIDLSILGRHLPKEEEIIEDDVAWTWDHLYASLSTELREEWAADHDRHSGRI